MASYVVPLTHGFEESEDRFVSFFYLRCGWTGERV